MAITSQPQKAGFPLTHNLKSGDLPKESWVKISQVRTLSVLRIGDRIGQIDQEEIALLIEGLNEIVSG
jgi:mRNA interferase MazF